MRSKKLRILTLAIAAILVQGTYVYAATSTKEETYTQEELDNLTPGWDGQENVNKSKYKVDSYKNTFSSTKSPYDTEDDDSSSSDSTTATTTNTTVDANAGNVIVSTSPSTGRKGDFWGKTKEGKWILIEQGVPASGWRNVRGTWYYMDADGVMQTGWLNDGQTWYYLNSDGSMAYNTYVDGYYLNRSGAMQ